MRAVDLVYMSFDRFPAPKGAATHIAAFCEALASAYGEVHLITIAGQNGSGSEPLPDRPTGPHSWRPGVPHFTMPSYGKNIVTRVMCYRSHLAEWWRGRFARVVHFRSIFEGYPVARLKGKLCKQIVFEVNGLPSIELKYHYPQVVEDGELLHKLRHQEDFCLKAADLIVTPSEVTANYLANRGAQAKKIRVIPNGVDTELFSWQEPNPIDNKLMRVLYSGTMTRWQGIHYILEALALYRRDFPANLKLVGPLRNRERKGLFAACDRLGVGGFVEFLPPVSQGELAAHYHACDVAVAPLPPNDRNLEQGCCPLKMLEAMAAGAPVIASDMPVVQCLAERDIEALLVRPGSAKAIKDGLLRLHTEKDLNKSLSVNARQRVERDFTWDEAKNALVEAYEEVLDLKPAASAN